MERSNYIRGGSDGGNRGGLGGRNRNYQQHSSNQHQEQYQEHQGGGRGRSRGRKSGGLGRGRGHQTHRTPAYPGQNADRFDGGSTWSCVAHLQVHEVQHVEARFATSLSVNTILRYDVQVKQEYTQDASSSNRPKSSLRTIQKKLCSSLKTAIMRWGRSAYSQCLNCISERVCA
ncbi:hypothetical protein L1987_87058 [Smallanthus sonchifolius]|nr:hypothetical protein L1987_87058 [Smallanthus sonchifolius]